MELIDKSALVAEIERRKKKNEEWKNSCKGIDSLAASMVIQEDINILSFLNTLEVKEVGEPSKDLEKHLKEDIEDVYFDLNGVAVKGATYYLTVEDIKEIAKHFFELGLNTKGE